jgi:hypothetical protein
VSDADDKDEEDDGNDDADEADDAGLLLCPAGSDVGVGMDRVTVVATAASRAFSNSSRRRK